MTANLEISGVTMEWLRETHPDIDARLEDPFLRSALGALTHTSRFLTRLLISDPIALEVVTNWNERPLFVCETEEQLSRWKQLELLRIAVRDLTGIDELEAVGARLARLADDVLLGACQLAGVPDLVVIGMGKLGGRELNYSSDIDIMFVGDTSEKQIREVIRIAQQSFRVDTALRPEGRNGPLTRSLESFEAYWQHSAQAWEMQALMKARVVCGSPAVGAAWEEAANNCVWSTPFGADEIREARAMKRRAEQLVAEKDAENREVKRGRGGIRDIEFAVQLLQLVHGSHDPQIRSTSTIVALGQLAAGGYIRDDDAEQLTESYRFLRTVEHRLQLVENQQTHTVPSNKTERGHLATVLGYRGGRALEQFENDLRRHQNAVRSVHERLYFRPLLEAFAEDKADTTSPLVTQLAAFGFTDAVRTRAAVEELTRGLARSSRLMQQLMPLLLDWLSTSPDPDEGLLGLRTLMSGSRTPAHIVNAFRDSPESARRLCSLLGTSKMFATGLLRHPEVLPDLSDAHLLMPDEPVIERLRRAMNWRSDAEQRHETLLRLTRAEQLRIAAGDVIGIADGRECANRRSQLAEAVLQLTLESFDTHPPVALIAMGRFGGGELSYVSDLDIIVVHGGTSAEDQQQAEAVAQSLLHLVANAAPTRHLYPLDYDLRPEGKKGVIARSIDGCADYYEHWADSWERQALVRARPIAGDTSTADAFMEIVGQFVWSTPPSDSDIKEMRLLKARMEKERIPRGDDPEFHLKLGPGSLSDVEWTTQLLQLVHHIPGTNTLQSLSNLQLAGHLSTEDHQVLEEAWTFCDRTRNRLFLMNNGLANSLPTSASTLLALSRSLDIPNLREDYKRVTRRSRKVMERVFYGYHS